MDTSSLPAFLTALGLPMYAPVFLRHDDRAAVRSLVGLAPPELRALGVQNPRHAQRIAEAVTAAVATTTTTTTTGTTGTTGTGTRGTEPGRGQRSGSKGVVAGGAKVTDKV